MTKFKILHLLFLIFLIPDSFAQTSECIKDFEFLINKIKDDYPGFKDKVKDENKRELNKFENELRNKINLYPDSCLFYFKKYVACFRDNHLRVGKINIEQRRPEKSNVSSFGRNVELANYSENQNGKTLEGVWTSWRGDIAIIREENADRYLGISINYRGWNANQVMFEFLPNCDTTYALKLHSNYINSTSKNGFASLHLNRNILEIHGDTYFVRKTSDQVYDKAILSSYVPEFPNGQNTFFVATFLSDSTFYLRVPSFMGFKDQIETTLKKNWENITSRPNLIIDIRNNGGGQDDEYQSLLKLIYTNPYQTKGVEWYATPGNIKIFEDALQKNEIRNGAEGIEWTNALVSEMKKNINGFVVHPSYKKHLDIPEHEDSIYVYPKRVGIIINEGNASSAEQFLLSAKNSKKVILFGNHSTAGVLDYSNAISVDFPSGKFKLTYPMTRSQRLPENPIDNIGIKPDVIIPFPATEQLFNRLDSWVYFVKSYLELSKR